MPCFFPVLLVLFLSLSPVFPKVHSVQARQRAMAVLNLVTTGEAGSGRPVKCGTWAHMIIRESWDALPSSAKEKYTQVYLAKPAQPKAERLFSWPPASPRFFIRYQDDGFDSVPDSDGVALDTAEGLIPGPDGIPDYVQWVAWAFDTTYRYLVNTLGYDYPVSHVGIRMRDLGNYYGLTYDRDTIALDNDMAFLVALGSDVRDGYFVTVAHEFFHMVQFCYQQEFNFFHEASATWMEDKMFPRVDDYVQYLELDPFKNPNNIMDHPERPLDDIVGYPPDNYDRVVWPMFLDQRYSPDVIRHAWEAYRAGDSLTSQVFEHALSLYQPSLRFSEAFGEFGRWMFYTDTARSAYCSTFTDARLWPAVRADTVSLSNFVFMDAFSLERLSLNYRYLKGREASSPGLWMAAADSFSILGTRTDTALRALLSESLFIARGPLAILPFSGPSAGEEAFGLFNFNESAGSGNYFLFDSVMTYAAGTLLPFSPYPGFRTEIVILDTLRIALKDSTGQPVSGGADLLQILHGKGIHIEPGALLGLPSSLDEAAKMRLYSIGIHPLIDSLMDLGKIGLRLTMADSSAYYASYKGAALHPGDGRRFALLLDGQGFHADYGSFRAVLPEYVIGGDSCRIFYMAVLRSGTSYLTTAFPNPAYSDDERLFFACDSIEESRPQCRLYTLSGALVRVLSGGNPAETAARSNTAGKVIFSWDFRSSAGRKISPGIYLYHIRIKEGYLPLIGKVAVLGKRRGE